MTTRWTPDTCTCIIDIDSTTITFVNWVQKCFDHKDLDGQALIDAISTHNKTFQMAKADQADKEKVLANMTLKRTEKDVSKNAGSVTVNEKLIRNSQFLK